MPSQVCRPRPAIFAWHPAPPAAEGPSPPPLVRRGLQRSEASAGLPQDGAPRWACLRERAPCRPSHSSLTPLKHKTQVTWWGTAVLTRTPPSQNTRAEALCLGPHPKQQPPPHPGPLPALPTCGRRGWVYRAQRWFSDSCRGTMTIGRQGHQSVHTVPPCTSEPKTSGWHI